MPKGLFIVVPQAFRREIFRIGRKASGRSPVISRTPVARPPLDTYYRRRLGNVETRGPLAKRAVEQRGAKNGESENP